MKGSETWSSSPEKRRALLPSGATGWRSDSASSRRNGIVHQLNSIPRALRGEKDGITTPERSRHRFAHDHGNGIGVVGGRGRIEAEADAGQRFISHARVVGGT